MIYIIVVANAFEDKFLQCMVVDELGMSMNLLHIIISNGVDFHICSNANYIEFSCVACVFVSISCYI